MYQRFLKPQILLLVCLVVLLLVWWRYGWTTAASVAVVLALVAAAIFGAMRLIRYVNELGGFTAVVKLLGQIPTDTTSGAYQAFLDQTEEIKNKGLNLAKLPAFVIVGESSAGKTTSLENSALTFHVRPPKQKEAVGNPFCWFWVADQGWFLDTAGRYVIHGDEPEDAERNSRDWENMLRGLVKIRPACPISGVVVTIPCNKLLTDSFTQRQAKAGQIRMALVEMQQTLKISFPVWVLLTKGDSVGGFAEFFQNLVDKTRRQLVGWSRDGDYRAPCPREQWQSGLEDMAEGFRRSRLSLLQRDDFKTSPEWVDRMFAFPDQFSRLIEPLDDYLSTIFPEQAITEPLYFRGVALTSSVQRGLPVWVSLPPLAPPEQDPPTAAMTSERVHFVRGFYEGKVARERGLIQPIKDQTTKVRWKNRIAAGTAGSVAAILLVSMLVWSIRLLNQVDRPNQLISDLNKNRTDQAAVRSLLFDSASDKPTLARLIEDIRKGKTLRSSVLSFNSADLQLSLVKLYRHHFVMNVLHPLKKEIDDTLAGTRGGSLYDPVEFERYKQAVKVYVQIAASDQRPDQEPATIAPLLHYCKSLTPEQREQIASAYLEYKKFEEGNSAPPADPEWKATAISAFLYVGRETPDQTIVICVTNALQRWGQVFQDDDAFWSVAAPAGGNDPASPCYKWFRAARLPGQLGKNEAALESCEDSMLKLRSELERDPTGTWMKWAEDWSASFKVYDGHFDALVHLGPDASGPAANWKLLHDEWASWIGDLQNATETHSGSKIWGDIGRCKDDFEGNVWNKWKDAYTTAFVGSTGSNPDGLAFDEVKDAGRQFHSQNLIDAHSSLVQSNLMVTAAAQQVLIDDPMWSKIVTVGFDPSLKLSSEPCFQWELPKPLNGKELAVRELACRVLKTRLLEEACQRLRAEKVDTSIATNMGISSSSAISSDASDAAVYRPDVMKSLLPWLAGFEAWSQAPANAPWFVPFNSYRGDSLSDPFDKIGASYIARYEDNVLADNWLHTTEQAVVKAQNWGAFVNELTAHTGGPDSNKILANKGKIEDMIVAAKAACEATTLPSQARMSNTRGASAKLRKDFGLCNDLAKQPAEISGWFEEFVKLISSDEFNRDPAARVASICEGASNEHIIKTMDRFTEKVTNDQTPVLSDLAGISRKARELLNAELRAQMAADWDEADWDKKPGFPFQVDSAQSDPKSVQAFLEHVANFKKKYEFVLSKHSGFPTVKLSPEFSNLMEDSESLQTLLGSNRIHMEAKRWPVLGPTENVPPSLSDGKIPSLTLTNGTERPAILGRTSYSPFDWPVVQDHKFAIAFGAEKNGPKVAFAQGSASIDFTGPYAPLDFVIEKCDPKDWTQTASDRGRILNVRVPVLLQGEPDLVGLSIRFIGLKGDVPVRSLPFFPKAGHFPREDAGGSR